MEKLKAEDIAALKRCRAELSAWDASEPIEQHLLRILPTLIESRVFTYQSFDFEKGTSKLHMNQPLPELVPFMETFFAYVHEHPLIRASRANPSLPATRISDLMPRESFQKTGLYNEFYRHVGFSNQLALSLPARPGDVIGLVYSREKDFTAREKKLFDLVRSHVLQIYRQARRFEFLLAKIQSLSGMLEALDQGLIALTETGRIDHITASGTQLLAKYFPQPATQKSTSRRHLPDVLATWISQITASTHAAHPASLNHTFTTPAGIIKARLCPRAPGWLLALEEQRPHRTADSFRVLGLTPRESEVLAGLVQGKTNAQIAQNLNARPRTIEKHIEHILTKLHVESRAAAIAKANQF